MLDRIKKFPTADSTPEQATGGVEYQPAGQMRRRVSFNVMWNFVALVLMQGTSFIASILAARILGREVFGEMAFIQNTGLMVGGIAAVGLGSTATKYIAELRATDRERVGRILGLSLIVTLITGALCAVLLLVAGPSLANSGLKAPQLATSIRIGSLFAFFVTINGYQTGALIGFEAFRRLAWVALWQGVLQIVSMYFLASHFGLLGATWAMVFAIFAWWALNAWMLRLECSEAHISVTLSRIWEERNLFVSFALPAALSGVIGGVALWASNLIVTRQPRGFEEIALFSAANSFRVAALFVPGVLSRVAAPLLCRLTGEQDTGGYLRVFRLNLIFSVAVVAVIGAIIGFGARPLLDLFGKSFMAGDSVVAALMLAAVAEVMGIALFQVLFSHGKIWLHISIQLIWASILCIGAIFLAPHLGALGLALAYFAAHTANILFYGVAVWRLIVKRKAVN